MADKDKKSLAELIEKRTELAAVFVLSVAALLTAWAGYQASLWDGEQAANYSRTNALRTQASNVSLSADARSSVEVSLFTHWLDAVARRDMALARFYRQRFPPEFKPAFDAWLKTRPLENPQAPPMPFAMPDYKRAGDAKAEALNKEADKTFAEGQRDNDISDGFTQATAILATALFFGGIIQIFNTRGARFVLLSIAALAVVVAIFRLMSLPVQSIGLERIL